MAAILRTRNVAAPDAIPKAIAVGHTEVVEPTVVIAKAVEANCVGHVVKATRSLRKEMIESIAGGERQLASRHPFSFPNGDHFVNITFPNVLPELSHAVQSVPQTPAHGLARDPTGK